MFRHTGAPWLQQAYLKPIVPENETRFGSSVDVSGGRVLCGTYGRDVLLYRQEGNGWTLDFSFSGFSPDNFVPAVAIDGDRILIGIAGDSNATPGIRYSPAGLPPSGAYRSGAVLVFQREAAGWTRLAYLKSQDPGVNDVFGYRVAIDGRLAVVSSPMEATSHSGINRSTNDLCPTAGAAWIFDVSGPLAEITGLSVSENRYHISFLAPPGIDTWGVHAAESPAALQTAGSIPAVITEVEPGDYRASIDLQPSATRRFFRITAQ